MHCDITSQRRRRLLTDCIILIFHNTVRIMSLFMHNQSQQRIPTKRRICIRERRKRTTRQREAGQCTNGR